MTQEDLADRTGVHSRTIAKIENGQIAFPRPSTVRLLANAFDLAGADRSAFLAAAAPGAPVSGPAAGTAEPVRPNALNQLPADVASFTGREAELGRLTAVLDRGSSSGTTAALISAIGGTAGVGKTALAVHWARRMRDRFPDGQLYVNLRGYDRDRPIATAEVLAAFLRALGLPPEEIPVDLDERASLYRSRLDGRRVLVLLDNAASVEQVRDLLPGGASCFALVTSRDSLGGLVARHGAERIELDLLPLTDALTLLRSLVGSRVDEEPAAATAMAQQCARLPLALRIAAELAVGRPESPLSRLVSELADEERRLALLDAGGDVRTALSAVFSWSYEALPEDLRGLFRWLSLHPGQDLDVYAAAVLADCSPETARAALERLLRAHLVHRTGVDRYGMHDLLRVYAASAACSIDSEAERRRRSLALFEHYVDTTFTATDTLQLNEPDSRPRVGTRSAGPALASRESAQAWLDAEFANLVAVADAATSAGQLMIAPALSAVLGHYTVNWRCPEGAPAIHQRAIAAARTSGDDAAQARSLAFLGGLYGHQGQHAEAVRLLERAVEIARASGEVRAEAVAVRGLGPAHWHLGNHIDAVAWFAQAIEISRAGGDLEGLALAYMNHGYSLWQYGRSEEALAALAEAVATCTAIGSSRGLARTLTSMSEVHRRQGRFDDAVRCGQEALALAQGIGDRVGEGLASRDLGTIRLSQGDLDGATDLLIRAMERLDLYPYGYAVAVSYLGEVRRRQGRLAEACEHQNRALAYFRGWKGPAGLAAVLTRIALIQQDLGQPEAARALLEEALPYAERSGARFEEAQVHAAFGDVEAALGSLDEARRHWSAALAIYEDLATPEAHHLQSTMLVHSGR